MKIDTILHLFWCLSSIVTAVLFIIWALYKQIKTANQTIGNKERIKYWVLLLTGCFDLYANISWLYTGEMGSLYCTVNILLFLAVLWFFKKEKQQ